MSTLLTTILPWIHRILRRENQSTVCFYCETGPLSPRSWRKLVKSDAVLYRTTRTRLLAGQKARCQLCALLVELGAADGPEAGVDLSLDQDPANPVDDPADAQYLLVHARVFGQSDKYMTYVLYTPEDDAAAADIVCKAPVLQVNSPRAHILALEAINDCIETHTTCIKPGRTPLPTRVIDCLIPNNPRLVLSADLEDVSAPYIALSYVWGADSSHCTILANYAVYLASIDHALVPQTIRDAILVTHNLGIRYIWVDAFCIIQDSAEDKVRELARMGSIYQDAYLTLIASSAPGGDAGFLQQRALPPHARVPYYTRTARLGSVCVGRRADTIPSAVPGKEPVDRRAWCFQERLLAPRKLVYATDTLRYHCHSAARPVGRSTLSAIRTAHSATLDHALLPIPLALRANPALASLSPDELSARQHMLWGTLVADYTRRALTRKTDRLLAFAAVAEQFARVCSPDLGGYVAGLWAAHLPRDLLWRRELAPSSWLPDAPRERPTEYVAPTWSWASVDGHVRVASASSDGRGGAGESCEVLECEVTLADARLPYGQVTGGRLALRAVLAPAWLVVEPDLPPPRDGEVDYGAAFYYKLFAPTAELVGRAAEEPEVRVGTLQPPWSDTDSGTAVTIDGALAREGRLIAVGWGRFDGDASLVERVGQADIYFDSPERAEAKDSWLVVVVLRETTGADGHPMHTAEGLLVTSAGSGRFRRIGYWSMEVNVTDDSRAAAYPWLRVDAEPTVIDLI